MITCSFKHALRIQNIRTELKLCQGAISTKIMKFSAFPYGKLNMPWRWLSTHGNFYKWKVSYYEKGLLK